VKIRKAITFDKDGETFYNNFIRKSDWKINGYDSPEKKMPTDKRKHNVTECTTFHYLLFA